MTIFMHSLSITPLHTTCNMWKCCDDGDDATTVKMLKMENEMDQWKMVSRVVRDDFKLEQ